MNDAAPGLVDLDGPRGHGPVWGISSEDLNATLLSWGSGEGVAAYVNAERDVLLVIAAGTGLIIIDGQKHQLSAQHALLIPKGTRREIRAGINGLRYLSVHLARGPLQIQQLADQPREDQ